MSPDCSVTYVPGPYQDAVQQEDAADKRRAIGALRAPSSNAPLAADLRVRRTLKVLTMLLVVCVMAGCSAAPQPGGFPRGVAENLLASPPPGDVVLLSLVALLSRPQDFDGKAVQVAGYGHFEFEGNALYLHREDLERSVVTNSIRLDVPEDRHFAPLNDQYVIVGGVFRASVGGMATRPGRLTEIFRYDPLPTREQMRVLSGRPR
jgi:hypothetical protein